jgi:hypothetical protein
MTGKTDEKKVTAEDLVKARAKDWKALGADWTALEQNTTAERIALADRLIVLAEQCGQPLARRSQGGDNRGVGLTDWREAVAVAMRVGVGTVRRLEDVGVVHAEVSAKAWKALAGDLPAFRDLSTACAKLRSKAIATAKGTVSSSVAATAGKRDSKGRLLITEKVAKAKDARMDAAERAKVDERKAKAIAKAIVRDIEALNLSKLTDSDVSAALADAVKTLAARLD